MSLILALALQAAAQGRQGVATVGRWAAFRDAAPSRCYALSEPFGPRRGAFASVATWPTSGARNQIHIRLSRPRAPAARVTLSIGERRFELVAGAQDAWAPDAVTDRAIVAAMRGGRGMSVESLSATGRPFADTYALAGAATTIDAAALACAGR
ncbi:hypothetical protein [Sphingomonas sp. RS2018]